MDHGSIMAAQTDWGEWMSDDEYPTYLKKADRENTHTHTHMHTHTHTQTHTRTHTNTRTHTHTHTHTRTQFTRWRVIYY